MIDDLKNFFLNRKLLVSLIIILTCMPFWWFAPGVIDIGGDSGRLYFHDPQRAIHIPTLYAIQPEGFGKPYFNSFNVTFYFLSYVIHSLSDSTWFTIGFFNAIKLVFGFVFTYLILRILIGNTSGHSYYASIIGGLVYLFSPIVIGNFDRALLYHNQVFLNPILFYLLLKYFLTKNFSYAVTGIVISVLFAHNFSILSAPPLFSFFPLSMLFLFCYVLLIRRIPIQWKNLIIICFFFVGVHGFHLLPTVLHIFDQSTGLNSEIFVKDSSQLKDHFSAVVSQIHVSNNFFLFSTGDFSWMKIIFPTILVAGIIIGRKNKTMLLTGIFFLIGFYMVTAAITYSGKSLYQSFFSIPGFNMFRNFDGQWATFFAFYYSLLFGQAVYFVFKKYPILSIKLFVGLIIVMTVLNLGYITGEKVNKFNPDTDIRYGFSPDPAFEESLKYIGSLRNDGKFLTLPFSDFSTQVIHGTNNGAYAGVSQLSFRLGRPDFPGYLTMMPLSDLFIESVKEKKYETVKKLLGLFQIRYIFHNEDERTYDSSFPTYPYTYMKTYFPDTQREYKEEFIPNLNGELIYNQNQYSVYELNSESYVPRISLASSFTTLSDQNEFVNYIAESTASTAAILRSDCELTYSVSTCDALFSGEGSDVQIRYYRDNPTRYIVEFKNLNDPVILLLNNAYDSHWKIYHHQQFDSPQAVLSHVKGSVIEYGHKDTFFRPYFLQNLFDQSLFENSHTKVNMYANAWIIDPQELSETNRIVIEMTSQRYIYFGAIISFISCILLFYFWFKNIRHEKHIHQI